MQIIQKKKEKWKFSCSEYFWEAYPMWIINICVFASSIENGTLILCFKQNDFENKKNYQAL